MQIKELEAHKKENMQYSDVKRDLREKIRDMRRQVCVVTSFTSLRVVLSTLLHVA